MRAEISAFPDGKYGFHDIVENDGIEKKPYTVAIDMYVQGDEIVADYDRSSPQAKGPWPATSTMGTWAGSRSRKQARIWFPVSVS